jgi:predicted DNA-binding transcriptional regulator YafY
VQAMRYSTARPPLKRMMVIDQALRSQTWPTGSSLAGAPEVNPRTIRRGLTYMRPQRRAPIAFDRGRQRYGYTEPTYQPPFLHLREGELVPLLLA